MSPRINEESNLFTFSPSQTISFEIEEKQSIEEQSFNVNASSNGSALKHRFEGENLEVISLSSECLKTQLLDEDGPTGSVPSIKLNVASDKDSSSFDTFTQLRCREDRNISGDNTTVSSIKVAGFNSQLNIKTKALHSTHNKNFGKNFQGIEEIPDENSV